MLSHSQRFVLSFWLQPVLTSLEYQMSCNLTYSAHCIIKHLTLCPANFSFPVARCLIFCAFILDMETDEHLTTVS